MSLDYQAQLTQIYNKLGSIQSDLSKLAHMSNVNTLQSALHKGHFLRVWRIPFALDLIYRSAIYWRD